MANESTPATPARSWWDRLSWPQVVFFAILILGVVLGGYFVPLEKLEVLPWEQVGTLALVILGVAGVAATKPAVDLSGIFARRRPERVDRVPPTGREGFVDLEMAGAIVGVGLLALAASAFLHGCGAGPLQTHVTVVRMSRVVVMSAEAIEEEAIRSLRAECDAMVVADESGSVLAEALQARESCRGEVIETARIVGLVHEAVVGLLDSYERGVRAAVEIDAGAEILAALARTGAGVAARLIDLADTIATRLERPIPDEVRAILTTVQAVLRALDSPDDVARVRAVKTALRSIA